MKWIHKQYQDNKAAEMTWTIEILEAAKKAWEQEGITNEQLIEIWNILTREKKEANPDD